MNFSSNRNILEITICVQQTKAVITDLSTRAEEISTRVTKIEKKTKPKRFHRLQQQRNAQNKQQKILFSRSVDIWAHSKKQVAFEARNKIIEKDSFIGENPLKTIKRKLRRGDRKSCAEVFQYQNKREIYHFVCQLRRS